MVYMPESGITEVATQMDGDRSVGDCDVVSELGQGNVRTQRNPTLANLFFATPPWLR